MYALNLCHILSIFFNDKLNRVYEDLNHLDSICVCVLLDENIL